MRRRKANELAALRGVTLHLSRTAASHLAIDLARRSPSRYIRTQEYFCSPHDRFQLACTIVADDRDEVTS